VLVGLTVTLPKFSKVGNDGVVPVSPIRTASA